MVNTTFAWFTSKDEVTNRLTASSDYGVSIVESFTPPKMWVPGETIDKDVYAVNTGSIPAFVKETVSGKLSIDFENTVNTFDLEDGNTYVELTEDEVELSMAGGYLVWNSAGVENGAFGTGYEPTATGDYIFRRAIKGATDEEEHPAATANAEKYTLEGYRYVAGTPAVHEDPGDPGSAVIQEEVPAKYYKIRIANYKTGQEDEQRESVAVNADGTLAGTPDIVYVTKDSINAEDVAFTYDNARNALVASYSLAPTAAAVYDETAIAARRAVLINNAKGEYEKAKYQQDIAEAELALKNKLIEERNKLAAAAKAYREAANVSSGAADAMDQAKQTVANLADIEAQLQTLAPYADRVLKSTDNFNADTMDPGYSGGLVGSYENYPEEVKTAITQFETKYGTNSTAGDEPTEGTGTLKTEEDFIAAYAALRNAVSSDDAAVNGDTNLNTLIGKLNTAYDNLKRDSKALYDAYADIERAAADATATGLELTDIDDYKKKLGGATQDNSYMKQVADWETTVEGIISKVEDFMEARSTSQADAGTANSKLTAFVNAISTYQTNVNEAMDGFYDDNDTPDVLTDDSGTLYTLYDNFQKTRNHTDDGTTDFNGGKDFQSDLIDDADGTYYVNPAADSTAMMNYTTSSYDVEDESTHAKPIAYANAIGGYDLTVDKIAKTAFHLHNDGDKDVLSATLESTTTAKYNEWQRLANGSDVVPTPAEMKIYVNLDEDWEDNWQMNLPEDDLNNTLTDAADRYDVEFYYKHILDAGKTSEKLIDSVTLDEATQGFFKNMTFDLNVELDSAQIVYNSDQTTIDTRIVDANDSFELKPTLADPKTLTAAVSWGEEEEAAATVYKVNGEIVAKPVKLATAQTLHDTESGNDIAHEYKITYLGTDYYGTTAGAGTFYAKDGGNRGTAVTLTAE